MEYISDPTIFLVNLGTTKGGQTSVEIKLFFGEIFFVQISWIKTYSISVCAIYDWKYTFKCQKWIKNILG